jgi:hypothetical protein
MRRAIFFAAWVISGFYSSISFGATYGGGSGTAVDPYQIWTPEQMNTIGANSGDWGKCFKLMTDIDMSAYTGTQYNIIGNSTTKFTGTFDGDGYVIRNLTYTTTSYISYVGLFGYASNSTIKNLGLENVLISSGGAYYVGGLIGYGTLNNIAYCYVIGSVSGSSVIGGLIGFSEQDSLVGSYVTGSVSGKTVSAGGLLGSCQSMIYNCFSTATVNLNENYQDEESWAGGLIGMNFGNVYDCYSTGSVNCSVVEDAIAGGLIGYNSGVISNCYSRGSVNASSSEYETYVGGLVGSLSGSNAKIEKCYSTGYLRATGDFIYKGGLLGRLYSGSTTACFWDKQTSGMSTSAGGTGVIGLTTVQMKTSSPYVTVGWDFADEMINGGADLWSIKEGIEYPLLEKNIFNGGDGSIENPYQIATPEQMYAIGSNFPLWRRNFILTADIDMSKYTGAQYNIIGNFDIPFTGMFNGNGHKIQNFTYITAAWNYYVGLFGSTSNAIIENIRIENVNISAVGRYAGSLVGYQYSGIISNCCSQGNIAAGDSGLSYTGGLAGASSGAIIDCQSKVVISPVNSVYQANYGGMVGYAKGTIANCFSEISFDTLSAYVGHDITVGGLAGFCSANVSNCQCVGSIRLGNSPSLVAGGLIGSNSGTVSNCYNNADIAISSSGTSFAGGLIASNSGIITNSCSAGSVDNNSNYAIAGGLIGVCSSGSITMCLSTGPVNASSTFVSADTYAGGLVGKQTYGSIIDCYSISSVSALCNLDYSGSECFVGGLVGYQSSAIIKRSYSIGNIAATGYTLWKGGLLGYSDSGTITSCFWDTQASGQTTSAGGTGKTTAQMQTPSTYKSAGWDFVDETENGIQDIWRIYDGINYPKLNWQIIHAGDWAYPDGVGAEDLGVLSSCWLETVESKTDINTDGTVNLADYIMLAQQWMVTGCGICGGADITGDGNVDEADLDLLAGQWLLEENTACKMADLNNNGKIDLADFAVFALHWLQL